MNKIQELEFSILRECVRICNKFHIQYFLLGGSALGAVRHAGFIPWDDDIDIGMPREEYQRFISIAPSELPPELFLQTHKTEVFYPMGFAKVRNSQTTFLQSNLAHLRMNHGICIDVFPLDGFPPTKWKQKWLSAAFNITQDALFRRLHVGTPLRISSVKTQVQACMIATLSAVLSTPYLRQLLEVLTRTQEYSRSDFVINWYGSWGLKEVVPRTFLGKGRDTQFEGLTVRIPEDCDGYLKSLYGDYRSLPPVEQRRSHHRADAIDPDNSYLRYLRVDR